MALILTIVTMIGLVSVLGLLYAAGFAKAGTGLLVLMSFSLVVVAVLFVVVVGLAKLIHRTGHRRIVWLGTAEPEAYRPTTVSKELRWAA